MAPVTSRALPMLVLAGLLSTVLAGCTGGEELFAVSRGGSMLADESGTFDAGENVRLSVAAGGTGTAKVTLKDASGATVFQQTFGGSATTGGSASNNNDCSSASGGGTGSGGTSVSCAVSGAAGTWRVEIDYTNYSGGFTLAITG